MIASTQAAIYDRISIGIIAPYAADVAPEMSPFIKMPAISKATIGTPNIRISEMIHSVFAFFAFITLHLP